MAPNFFGQVGNVAGKDQYHFNAGTLVVPPYCWLSIRASRIEHRDRFMQQNAAYYKELQDYEKRVQRYQADRPIWETSWLCTSCGKGWRSG
jgi:hypothetical protein